MLQPEDKDEIDIEIENYKRRQKPLPELSILINELHKEIQAQEGIIGEYLGSAKVQHQDHEQWLLWLQENCPGISERMAQRYTLAVPDMKKLAESFGHLEHFFLK